MDHVIVTLIEGNEDSIRIQKFLDQYQIEYSIDVIHSKKALESRTDYSSPQSDPLLKLGTKTYSSPSNESLKKIFGIIPQSNSQVKSLPNTSEDKEVFDTIIIGSGVAGLTAAIEGQKQRLNTLIIEHNKLGGNLAKTSFISNLSGIQTLVGNEHIQQLAKEAQLLGAKIELGIHLKAIKNTKGWYTVDTSIGTFTGRTIVFATGANYHLLNVETELDYVGKGIHYLPTSSYNNLQEEDIVVFGGDNLAVQEACKLALSSKRVTLVHDALELTADEYLQTQLNSLDNLGVYVNKIAVELIASDTDSISTVVIRDNQSGRKKYLTTTAIYVLQGNTPNTSFFKSIVELDANGYIITNSIFHTSQLGMFAIGDCRNGTNKNAPNATIDGKEVISSIKDYLGF